MYPKDAKKALLDFPAWPFGGVLFPGDGTVICQSGADSSYEVFDLRNGKPTVTNMDNLLKILHERSEWYLNGDSLLKEAVADVYDGILLYTQERNKRYNSRIYYIINNVFIDDKYL